MRLTRIVPLVLLLALIVVPAAAALRFTDESYFIPVGVVGQPYTKQFNGELQRLLHADGADMA